MNSPHGFNPRAELFGTNLSPNRARLLLIGAGNSLLGDESLAALPTRRQFAAEYIGRLFDAIDEQEAFGDMVTEEYSDDPAEINMGVLIKSAVTDMRVAYGSPELQGTDSPLNPQYHEGGLNAAVEAEDGIETVRHHIEAVYAQGC